MNNYLSIITLNVKGLNAQIKTHRVTKWIIKEDPHVSCQQENHLREKTKKRKKQKTAQPECEGLEKKYSKEMDKKNKPR